MEIVCINYTMQIKEYDRGKAVAYARRWAFSRNPKYYNFDALGGDCTNFASQCVFAGAGVMNYTPVTGWFYRTASDRTASWTGVEFFYNFLTGNKDGAGPFAEVTDMGKLEVGDIVQLGKSDGEFYHSPVVVGFAGSEPLLAAHTYDAFGKRLSSYRFERVRFLHISGVRV